jgi:trans-aconitate methyltransferase
LDDQTEATAEPGEDFWRTHYDELADHDSLVLFRSESKDYFSRLLKAFPLSGRERVLDFGCGFGFITAMLASKVQELHFWDNSDGMLARTAKSMSRLPNAVAADLSNAELDVEHQYDLIVINSVIQYMSEEELAAWLKRWHYKLDVGAAVLISDVILPRSAFFREVYDSLKFAAGEGFLLRTLWQDGGQFLKYLITRKQAPMSRYSQEYFSSLAQNAGFDVEILADNLTYRSSRFSAVLRRSAEPG